MLVKIADAEPGGEITTERLGLVAFEKGCAAVYAIWCVIGREINAALLALKRLPGDTAVDVALEPDRFKAEVTLNH